MPQNIDFDLIMRDRGGIATAAKFDKSLTNLDKSQKSVSSSAAGLWKQFVIGGAAMLGINTAIRGFTGFIKDSIAKSGEAQKVNAQLNAVLKSTGGIAGITAGEVQRMAGELSLITTYGKTATVEAANLLLTFTKIGKDVFPDTLAIVQDMSIALKQDLKSSAIQVGKALQDPILGVTALRRVGVNFAKDQVEVIKKMVETGDAAGAQAYILKELQTEFGGSAKAAAETFPGAIAQLNNAFSGLKRGVGDAIIQNQSFRDTIKSLKEKFADPDFQKSIAGLFSGFSSIVMLAVQAVAALIKTVISLKDVIIPLGAAIATAFAVSKIKPFFDASITYFRVLKLEGVTNLNAVGGAIDATRGKTGVLTGGINGVKGALANVGPMAIAAFAGWGIGTLINDLLGLEAHIAAISKFEMDQAFKFGAIRAGFINIGEQSKAFTDKMEAEITRIAEKYGIQRDEVDKNSKAFNELSDMAQKYYRSVDLGKSQENINLIKELGGKLTRNSKSLRDNAIAVLNNKEAFSKLNAEQQGLVKNIVSHVGKTKDLKKEHEGLTGTVKEVNKEFKEQKEILLPVSTAFNDLLPPVKKFSDYFSELHAGPMPGVITDLNDITQELRAQGLDVMPGVVLNYERLVDRTKKTSTATATAKKETIDLSGIFTSLATATEGAFKSIEQLGINLGALPAIMQAVVGGLNSIGSGLNALKNPGKGFAGILGSISGGFSLVTGAISVVSGILKIFSGPSGELEAARRRLQGLSVDTKEWEKKIEELAKSLGGADSAGRAFNALLADIIRDSDITVNNFDSYITKVREIVSTYEQGNATIEETQRNFGAAFDAIIKSAQSLGIEGSQSLRGLIGLASEFGLDVKEINDYIEANMKTALGGWQDAIKTFGNYSIPIFDNMIALQAKIADNQQLVDSIKGANQAMMDLAKTPNFTGEQFNVFQQIAVDAMNRLQASGFSAAQAMESDAGLRGMLQNIIFLSGQYGFKVDENTQKLIDEGIASGALTKQQQSESDIMIDGFDRMIGRMDRLIELMGGEMPDAMNEFGKRSIDALDAVIGSTDRLSDSVGRVYGNIGDIINQFNNLGQTSDDVMWRNSIIPDFEKWENLNQRIEAQLKQKMVEASIRMGDAFTVNMTNMDDIATTFNDQMIEDVEVLRDLYEKLGLDMVAAGMGTSKYERYGIGAEEKDTAQFAELQELWRQNWEIIAKSDKGLQNFIGDLSDLDVLDSLEGDLTDFIAWVTYAGEQMKAGLVWDPASMQFIQPTGFQGGTGGQGFKVPEGYPDDSYKVGLTSGEKIYVEPKGYHGPQNVTNGGDTWNFYVTIQATPGGDTVNDLMDKFYYGVKNNAASIRPRLRNIGVQING